MRLSVSLVVSVGLSAAAFTAQSQPAPAAAIANAAWQDLGSARQSIATLEAEIDTDGVLTVRLPVAGVEAALVLYPHSVRSSSFQLLIEGEDGQLKGVRSEPAGGFRGEVLFPGDPSRGGTVTASYLAGQLEAALLLDDGSRYLVQPVRHTSQEAPSGLHAVLRTAAAGSTNVSASLAAGFSPAESLTSLRLVEIAIDADVEFCQQNGSSLNNTLADIENVMNGVSALYEAQVGARFEITTVIVRTAEADPYTFTIAGGLLNQFKGHWNTTKVAVHRDLAHLFTGKDLDGTAFGAGFYSVACSQANGYALSQSHFSANFDERVAATAHYPGRNFSANHCDGEPDCAVMCTTINGCHGVTTFGASARFRIGDTLANQPCLSDQPPAARLPFEDTFPSDLIDTSLWTHVNGATVDSGSVAPPSGARALRLGASGPGTYDDDEIRSNFIDLSLANSATLTNPLGVTILPQGFTHLGTSLRELPRVALAVSGSITALATLSDLDGDGHPELLAESQGPATVRSCCAGERTWLPIRCAPRRPSEGACSDRRCWRRRISTAMASESCWWASRVRTTAVGRRPARCMPSPRSTVQ